MSGIPSAVNQSNKPMTISDETHRVNSTEDLAALEKKLTPRGSNRRLVCVGSQEVKVIQMPSGLIGRLKYQFSATGAAHQKGMSLLQRTLQAENRKRHSENAHRDTAMSSLARILLKAPPPSTQSTAASGAPVAASARLDPKDMNDIYEALSISDEQERIMRDHIRATDPKSAALSDQAKLKEALCILMINAALTLRDEYQCNWEHARHALAHSDDTQSKAKMGELIIFRRILVDSLVNSMRQSPTEASQPHNKPWTPLIFNAQAVGSTALTSDYDLTLNSGKSNDDIKAIRRFNRDIELMFGVQPGTLLDTNLYAGDYGEARETLSMAWKSQHPASAASTSTIVAGAQDHLEETDPAAHRALEHLSSEDQHIVALTKLRMSLSDKNWQQYGESLIHQLEHSDSTGLAKQSHEALDSADAIWCLQTAKLVTSVIADLPNQSFRFGEHTLKMNKGHLNINDFQFIPILQSTLDALEAAYPDLCLKTRNELYLESIEKTKALSSYDALPGEDKNVRKLRAIGQSLYFAPEAYYTAGAVRHVVEGIQVARGDAIKTLKDSVAKQPAAWRSAQAPSGLDKLSSDDLLASAIEQVADSFCHAASDSPVRFLVNGSKYLGRMLDAVTKADTLMRRKDLANQTQSAPLSPGIVNALLNAAHRSDALASQITAKDLALILKVTALASKKEELQLDVWEVQDLKQMMGRKIKAPWPAGAKTDNFSEAVFGDKLAQHFAKVIHNYEQDQEKNELLLSKAIHDASIDAESPEKAKAVESLSNRLCSGIKISLTAEASKVGETSFKDLVEVQLKRLFSLDASQAVSESAPANSSNTSPASQATGFNNRLLTCLAALETAPR